PQAIPSVFMSAQPARAASAPSERAASAPASRTLAVFTPAPPPQSTLAIGGDPRRVRGMIDPHAGARQELFMRALAATSDAQQRQLDEQGREIAALRQAQHRLERADAERAVNAETAGRVI